MLYSNYCDVFISVMVLSRWWNVLCQYPVTTGQRSLILMLMALATLQLRVCRKVLYIAQGIIQWY